MLRPIKISSGPERQWLFLMKKIIPAIVMILVLCSCTTTTQTAEHDLSTYDTDGYYQVLGSDTTYIDYQDAAIPDLILSGGDYHASLHAFEINSDDSFSAKDVANYTVYKKSDTSPYRIYRDNDISGGKYYPDFFIQYSAGDSIYYSVGSVTSDDEYAASADGKTMIFLTNEGLLAKYDADAGTLTAVGSTSYNGQSFSKFDNRWVIKFALDESGRYAAYTTQRRAAGQTDIFVYDFETGTEEMLAQNIAVSGDLSFWGNQLIYRRIDTTGSSTEYDCILTDMSTKTQTIVPWDGNYTTVKNGYIVGQSQVYDIDNSTAYAADSLINGRALKGILSDDGQYVVSVYGDDSDGLFFNVVSIASNTSVKYKLPGDFKSNFSDFIVLDMRGSQVIFQVMTLSGDQSGDNTAYYTIDLGFAMQ